MTLYQKIIAVFGMLRTSIDRMAEKSDLAPDFSDSSSYDVGRLVFRNGSLYRCIVGHSGAWDASHFVATTIDEALDPARLPAQSFTFGKAANFSHSDDFHLLFCIADSAGRKISVDYINVDSTNLSFSDVAFVTISGYGNVGNDSVDIIALIDGVARMFYVGTNRQVTLTANSSILPKDIIGTIADSCLVAGTMVLMADGSWRRIEDVVYGDTLLTWDREAGRTVAVRPSWIMRPYEATHWYECRFASGRTLCTTGAPFDPGHRVYSLDTGRYEYERDAIGHRVLSVTQSGGIGAETRYEPGEDVLESVACIPHRCTACNIITEGRFSLIAEGVLTSCRLSNPGMSEDEIAAYWARLERSRKPREV